MNDDKCARILICHLFGGRHLDQRKATNLKYGYSLYSWHQRKDSVPCSVIQHIAIPPPLHTRRDRLELEWRNVATVKRDASVDMVWVQGGLAWCNLKTCSHGSSKAGAPQKLRNQAKENASSGSERSIP